MYRSGTDPNNRKSRAEAHFDQLRKKTKLDDENEHASVHTLDQRLFKKGRQFGSCGGFALHVLQLRQDSSDAEGDSRNGNGNIGSCVEFRGNSSFSRNRPKSVVRLLEVLAVSKNR